MVGWVSVLMTEQGPIMNNILRNLGFIYKLGLDVRFYCIVAQY